MQQDGKQIDDVWVQTGLQQPLVLTRTEKKLVRSEEHTSELQSQSNVVCRLLLEKKNMQVRHAPMRRRQASSRIVAQRCCVFAKACGRSSPIASFRAIRTGPRGARTTTSRHTCS